MIRYIDISTINPTGREPWDLSSAFVGLHPVGDQSWLQWDEISYIQMSTWGLALDAIQTNTTRRLNVWSKPKATGYIYIIYII